MSERFTRIAQRPWDVRLDATVEKVERYAGGVRAHLSDGSTVEADLLLVATGRTSNADGLDLDRTGVLVDDEGVIVVDDHQRTAVDGIWALGDVANHWQLKHVANHEARVVQHNLLHLDDPSAWQRARRDAVPSAVFSSPQVGTVGLTERDAVAQGIDHVVARQDFGDVAYGWAMEDTTGFAKVLADPATGQILGGHFLGPQASNLVQSVVHAMSFGQTAHDVARGQYWIHPALMEVVENVLLGLYAAGWLTAVALFGARSARTCRRARQLASSLPRSAPSSAALPRTPRSVSPDATARRRLRLHVTTQT